VGLAGLCNYGLISDDYLKKVCLRSWVVFLSLLLLLLLIASWNLTSKSSCIKLLHAPSTSCILNLLHDQLVALSTFCTDIVLLAQVLISYNIYNTLSAIYIPKSHKSYSCLYPNRPPSILEILYISVHFIKVYTIFFQSIGGGIIVLPILGLVEAMSIAKVCSKIVIHIC